MRRGLILGEMQQHDRVVVLHVFRAKRKGVRLKRAASKSGGFHARAHALASSQGSPPQECALRVVTFEPP